MSSWHWRCVNIGDTDEGSHAWEGTQRLREKRWAWVLLRGSPAPETPKSRPNGRAPGDLGSPAGRCPASCGSTRVCPSTSSLHCPTRFSSFYRRGDCTERVQDSTVCRQWQRQSQPVPLQSLSTHVRARVHTHTHAHTLAHAHTPAASERAQPAWPAGGARVSFLRIKLSPLRVVCPLSKDRVLIWKHEPSMCGRKAGSVRCA